MAKTIKVIELLNKIARGEEVPELIEYNGEDYIFQNTDYKNEDRDLYLFSEEIPDITAILNDTVKIVEIIEEQQDIDIQGIEEQNVIKVLCDSDFERNEVKDILNMFFEENQRYINAILQAVKQLDRDINKLKEK